MALISVRRGYLPREEADGLRELWDLTRDWARESQESTYGPSHQSFSAGGLPQDGESYVASFERSASLEDHQMVRNVVSGLRGTSHRCYRLLAGDGFRVHVDDYFGRSMSHVLYLSPRWEWDWGGLLHVLDDDGERCEVVLPEMNLLVTTSHEGGRTPHFVSRVAPWAASPRYMLSVFGA